MTEVIAPPAERPVTKTRLWSSHGSGSCVDHVPDRERLTVVPLAVLALKPVEAALRIVRGLLLWNEQGKAERSASVDQPAP